MNEANGLRALVVGGGIFGVTAAIELRARGASVTLVDPGPLPHPDASSTDISKIIRMDYGADERYTALMERSLQGWDAWNARWGAPLYHEDGFLLLSRGPMRPGGFEHDSFETLRRRGHAPERIDPDVLRARFPAWPADRYPDGYFNPRAGWAESARVVEQLVLEARAAGVCLREGFAIDRLLEEDASVTGVLGTAGERIEADRVIVAAGAWTPTLLPHLGEVMRAVGQPVLHFRVEDVAAFQPPRFPPWAADIGRTGWYGFPARPDGTLKIANHGVGQAVDPAAPRVVDEGAEARFRAFLAETFPAIVDAPLVGTRLCLYCDTFDGDFWIDRDIDRAGLTVAAGGSGHAFKFGPVLGAIIADVALGRENTDAARFARRPAGPRASEGARHLKDGHQAGPGRDG